MATKKAKNTKNAKGTKMTTKTATKKRNAAGATATEREVVTIKPYEGPITIVPNEYEVAYAAEARAAVGEAVDGLDPEARAEEVEALDLETEDGGATAEEPAVETEIAPSADATPIPIALDPATEAERLLRDLGFERTGKVIDQVSAKALLCAAETWRDRRDRESRIAAEDVASRAGWFRAPEKAPAPAPETAPAATAAPVPAPQPPDLAVLRTAVEEAKAALAAAEADAKRLEEEARDAIAKAKDRYRAALAPYRDACKVQGHACEYEGGGRSANVSERVTFEVALVGESIRIAVKGRPESAETIPVAEVRAGPSRVAARFCERWIGPKEVVGNKEGSLGNRLRAVLAPR